eukprot:m.77651 g.77651  ORF g.77651 m.77651 type:complete len:516 (+) comp14479_c0_seq2:104-1651(+)
MAKKTKRPVVTLQTLLLYVGVAIAAIIGGQLIGTYVYPVPDFRVEAGAFDRCSKQSEATAARGNLPEAIQQLWPCLKAHPVPHGYYNLGQMYYQTGQFYKARTLFHRAMERLTIYARRYTEYPKRDLSADIYNNLALCYIKQQDKVTARAMWHKSLQARGDRPQISFALATSELDAGLLEDAHLHLLIAAEQAPDVPHYHYALAVAQRRLGKPFEAHLKQAISPSAGTDLVTIGLRAKELGELADARQALQLFLTTNPTHPNAVTAADALLDVLAALDLPDERQQMLDKLVAEGIFHHPLQRPGYLHPSLLPGEAWPANTPKLSAALADLETVFEAVQLDLTAQGSLSDKADLVLRDEESLTIQGDWQQVVLVRDGAIHQHAFNEFLYAGRALLELVERYSKGLPKGSLELSTIAPGTHIRPHCGPSNHRLRLHLGIQVPETGAALTVAGQQRAWRKGEAFVFDDSFEHEVWNNSTEPRTILIFDIWHPKLSQAERKEIRQRMNWRPFGSDADGH